MYMCLGHHIMIMMVFDQVKYVAMLLTVLPNSSLG